MKVSKISFLCLKFKDWPNGMGGLPGGQVPRLLITPLWLVSPRASTNTGLDMHITELTLNVFCCNILTAMLNTIQYVCALIQNNTLVSNIQNTIHWPLIVGWGTSAYWLRDPTYDTTLCQKTGNGNMLEPNNSMWNYSVFSQTFLAP